MHIRDDPFLYETITIRLKYFFISASKIENEGSFCIGGNSTDSHLLAHCAPYDRECDGGYSILVHICCPSTRVLQIRRHMFGFLPITNLP